MSGNGATTDFPLVDRGYDPGKVDEYLATQMLQLREQLDAATTRVVELEDELEAAHQREDAVRLTMMAATKARDELLDRARDEAGGIIGDARRVAFLLMTESRTDADKAIAESKVLVDVARSEALAVVADAEEESQRLVAERQQLLAKLHTEYEAESALLIERINTLRRIADDLSAKVAAPASQISQDLPSPEEGRTANASNHENVPDYEEDGEAPIADHIRGSFSRRSAKLPRLGEEAGRSALAAATAMRAHLTSEPDQSASAEEREIAVRTA